MTTDFNIKEDIKAALLKYKGLNFDEGGETMRVYGDIDVLDPETSLLIETFSVEIIYPQNFPYSFPKVIETGGLIPRTIDRHIVIKDDNRLCLVVWPEERLLCLHGITTIDFLDRVLVPRLAEEFMVNNGGKYEHEYPHGYNAFWEFYLKILKLEKREEIIPFLEMVIQNRLPKGFHLCTCGSGKKFNHCHLQQAVSIGRLGKPYLIGQCKILRENEYKPVIS